MDGQRFLAFVFVFTLLGLGHIGLIGAGVWFTSTYGKLADAMRQCYTAHAVRCVVVGVFDLVAAFVVFAILSKMGPLAVLGVLFALLVLSLAAIGMGIAFWDIGLRVTRSDDASNSSRAILLGGGITAAAFLAPVLGQVLFCATVCRGLGAAVLTLLRRTSVPRVQE